MKFIGIGALLLCIVVTVLIVTAGQSKEKQRMQIGNKILLVTVADTDEKRRNGLSNTKKLKDNEGMLFMFDASGKYPFWMKDMNYDLDFIYIHDGRVVGVIENVPAPPNNNGETAVVNPPVPFTQVLEVNSGFIKKNKIAVGQKVKFVT